MKFYWFNKHCCVPECFNSSTEGEGCFKEYFDLPAEPQARSKWLNVILMDDGENMKVCEDHFKDDDVFRDKSNRKKLRLNSIPSRKLPKNICTSCFGSTKQSSVSADFEGRACRCALSPTGLQPNQEISSVSKRTRIKWSAEEKRTLFRAIKKYGDVRVGNNNIRINWTNVVNHCRSNGCFGNEKELKSVWQNIRVNATKVHKNDIFGSKLDRKVSRFLYGKPLKRGRGRGTAGCSTANGSSNHMDVVSTDDEEEFNEQSRPMIYDLPEEDEENNNCAIIEGKYEETGANEAQIDGVEKEAVSDDDESDEYYSISDVEEIFQIKIRPRPPESPTEIISLLSSEDEEY